jgi:hypothetical protein
MANEIYHRSNWGNAVNDIAWGDVYEKFDATNEMFVRSDNYENSNETDKLMAAINPKPSILLTPTAYDNGSLHSVKPVKTFGSELIDLTQGTAEQPSQWSNITTNSVTFLTGAAGTRYFNVNSTQSTLISGKKYSLTLEISNYSGSETLGLSTQGNVSINARFDANGTHSEVFTSNGQSLRIFGRATNSATITLSVKEVTDADFDFTRGTTATRVNEQGLIEDVQILSGELVQNGDFEQIGSELVTNGDFATDSDWTLGNGWSISGGKAILVDGLDPTYQIYQLISGLNTKNLKVTFDVTDFSGDAELRYPFRENITGNGSYTFYGVGTLDRVQFQVKSGFTASFSIDNVSVKEVGQNWTFGTGWSMGDGVAICDGTQSSNSNLQSSTFDFSGNPKVRLSFDVVDYSAGNLAASITGTGQADLTGINSIGTYSVIAVSSAGSRYVDFTADANFVGSIDNISVIEITDDTDLPRIDYTDGTGSLLLEPQSTNVLENSEITSTWTYTEFGSGSSGTITTGKTDMFGGTNAIQIDFPSDAENVTLAFGQTTSSISSGSVSGSVYIKLVESGSKTLQLRCSSGLKSLINVDTTKFVRYKLSGTKTNNEAFSLKLRPSEGTSSGGFSIIVCQPQEEALSYATSYIPTSGSTVTRDADVCNNSGSSDLINSTEGVLYAEAFVFDDDTKRNQIEISDGSNDNRVIMRFDKVTSKINCFLKIGGTTKGNISLIESNFPNGVTFSDTLKVAYKWKSGDIALWFNGVETNTSTNTFTISSDVLNVLNLQQNNGTNLFCGKVKSVAVFKEALTDEELTALTT